MAWQWWQRPLKKVPLVFRWKRPHLLSFRLAFFLFVSTVAHLAMFYFFAVVYPPNKKGLIQNATIWLLPPGDPGVQAMMRRNEGAFRAFWSGGKMTDDSSRIEIPMRHSSENYTPEFLPLPERDIQQPLIFPDAVPLLLPPVIKEIVESTPASTEINFTRGLVWELAGVEVKREPMPEELEKVFIRMGNDAGSRIMQVSYGKDRRIREVLIIGGEGSGDNAMIRRGLMGVQVPEGMPDSPGRSVNWCTLKIIY